LGKGQVALPPASAGVVDLGFVSRQDKADAYAAATALVQPSLNESFSLVLMESWLQETPVLVHGACAVTREHARLANGGLYYTNFAEFAATADYLLEHMDVARKMGQNGRRYVLENYRWSHIIAQYEKIIAQMKARVRIAS
jgi:glycosyltransferase involved in cell wall biosynthesis